jgi:predicted PurR-regulated permease PerM
LGIELAVLYVVMVIVRNILEPKIVGRQIGVHPLAMLISMYVGLRIFGFIGIFILPLILVVIKGFYENKEKELE